MPEKPPEVMHLLFENGLYLSAFSNKDSALRTKEARESEDRVIKVATYWRKT